MTDLQRKLDSVISNVQRELAKNNQLIPVKIENGVRVGNVDIINDGHLKNLYQRNELRYKGISLNKVAIKMANLMAISYFQNQTQIDELYRADQQFGQALEDYQIFRAKYQQADNSARADIMLARLCYSKDKANYYKNQALRLAQ
jgi:flagellar biosynthesis component FlhA